MTESLDPRNRRAYRRRAAPYLLPAYLLVLAGVGALLAPPDQTQTTVSLLLDGRVELLWQVSYIIGGLLIVVGGMWPRPDVEAAGHWLAVYALVVNLIALLAVRGLGGSGLASASYTLTATICILRVVDLHRRARAAPITLPDRLERRASSVPFAGADRREP